VSHTIEIRQYKRRTTDQRMLKARRDDRVSQITDKESKKESGADAQACTEGRGASQLMRRNVKIRAREAKSPQERFHFH
jgi:hypothetical protein